MAERVDCIAELKRLDGMEKQINSAKKAFNEFISIQKVLMTEMNASNKKLESLNHILAA